MLEPSQGAAVSDESHITSLLKQRRFVKKNTKFDERLFLRQQMVTQDHQKPTMLGAGRAPPAKTNFSERADMIDKELRIVRHSSRPVKKRILAKMHQSYAKMMNEHFLAQRQIFQ